MGVENPEQHLKKHVSFLGLLAMCVGLNIGGALFALTAMAAGFSGPSLPLAMLVSAIPVLLAVVPYVTLTSVMPTTSATYRYSQLFSPSVAIVSVLTLLVCILIGAQPLYAMAFGKYLEALLPVDPIRTGVGVLTVFYVINLMGVRLTAQIQTVLFFMLLSALILYIVLGLPSVQAEYFSPLFPNGVGGVLAASGLLFTFSAGGIFVIDLGGEVMRAKKTFSRALPAGIGIAVLLYALIGAATVGVVDVATLPDKTSLIEVAKRFMPGPALTYFIVGGALVACATTINIVFTILSRGLLVVSEEGLLPRSFGRVNARFGTPHWGLTVAYLVCVAALVSRIQHETGYTIQPGPGEKFGVDIGRTAGRHTTPTFDTTIVLIDRRSNLVIHALLYRVGIEGQALMNPGFGALDHAAEPASGINGQVADQLEHRQRVQVDLIRKIGRQRATRQRGSAIDHHRAGTADR